MSKVIPIYPGEPIPEYDEDGHVCPYAEDLFNDKRICYCTPEETRRCAEDI